MKRIAIFALVLLTFNAIALADEDRVITLACGGICSDQEPQTPYDDATCADMRLNEELIAAAQHGDRSAIAQLEMRFDKQRTFHQKNLIANALLNRAADDRRYWHVLETFANDAIRFAYANDEPPRQFVAWCEKNGANLDAHRGLALDALTHVAVDGRSPSILERALATNDYQLIEAVLAGMSERRDESLLPRVREALARMPRGEDDHVYELATYLASFRSDSADAIAKSVLDAEELNDYFDLARELAQPPADPLATDDSDERLIEAATRNDGSARELLQQRFAEIDPSLEKIRIAAVLLRHVDDDREYWRFLESLANDAIRFDEDDVHHRLAMNALHAIERDPRARDIYLRALESNDPLAAGAALMILAQHKDTDVFPAMKKTVERLGSDVARFTLSFSNFQSAEADAVALSVMNDELRELYKLQR